MTPIDTVGWNEIVAVPEELSKFSAAEGWVQGTLYTRTVGRFNELCLEREYADLATFERESTEQLADPGVVKILRRLDALKLEDVGFSEMWEEATPIPD